MNTLYVQGKSVSTINGARRVLFQLCKYATRQELMMFNPVSKTDPLKQDPKKSNVQAHWNRDEAKRALEVSVGTPLDLFVHLAIFTGMRRGEVLGLKWSDIDLSEGTLSVERTLKEERIFTPEGLGTTHLVTGDPKTISGFRKLAIQGPLVNAFMRHKEAQIRLQETAGEEWVNTDFVLTSSVGTPWNPSNLSTRFRKFLKDNDLRRIRIHDMRHTAAHLSLEGDVRLEAVSQALGHSRIEITKNTYARKVPKLAIDFSNGLAEYLSPVDDAIADLMINPDGHEFSEETLNGAPKR
jgi:integrase